jgi:hypothetical protein
VKGARVKRGSETPFSEAIRRTSDGFAETMCNMRPICNRFSWGCEAGRRSRGAGDEMSKLME